MRELMEKQEAIERNRNCLDKVLENGNGMQDESVIRAKLKLEQLQEVIERQRSRLNKLLEEGNGMQDEDVIRVNLKVDRLLEDYIELKKQIDMGVV